MKKLFTLSLAMLIALMLCACTVDQPASSPEPSNGNVQNTQETPTGPAQQHEAAKAEVNIIIEPPAGWEPVTGSVLKVQYLKGTVSFMVKEENFAGKTLDEVVTEAKEAFSGAFADVAYEGEAAPLTVDGKDAKEIVFTCKVSGMQMKYEYIYLFVNQAVYAITFGGPADTFDSLASDYGQIIQDIKFQ